MRSDKGFRGGAIFLSLGEKNFRLSRSDGAAPENSSLEKAKDKAMFQGMTIEELIRSVERAEQHARDRREPKYEFRDFPLRRMDVEELEVA